jgi:hypothetical protein
MAPAPLAGRSPGPHLNTFRRQTFVCSARPPGRLPRGPGGRGRRAYMRQHGGTKDRRSPASPFPAIAQFPCLLALFTRSPCFPLRVRFLFEHACGCRHQVDTEFNSQFHRQQDVFEYVCSSNTVVLQKARRGPSVRSHASAAERASFNTTVSPRNAVSSRCSVLFQTQLLSHHVQK